jgi:hypothetical protein
MPLSPDVLRLIQRNLGKVAVALVRSERELTNVTRALHPGDSAERGTEVRITEVEFAEGPQPYVPELYSGPSGGYYETRPGYVLECWSPGGVRLLRQWHPDVMEYVFVRSGELVDLVSGKRTIAGQVYEVDFRQSHEYFFPVDTNWTLVYSLVPDSTAHHRATQEKEHVPA